MNKQKITVLMSTFNGEKYIEKQIESILEQKDVQISLVIRDDESSDSTVSIIEEYEKKYSNISLIRGKNLGARKSFRQLVLDAPDDDYYAFADQDDIWYANKLIMGISCIQECSNPALYYCNQNCVDELGNIQYRRFGEKNIQPDFSYTLFRNNYAGCTMVFNKKLMQAVQKAYRQAAENIDSIHDGWVLMIAQLIGETYYDADAYMDFRRHGNNYSEAQLYSEMKIAGKLKLFIHKIDTFKKTLHKKGNTIRECIVLRDCFKDIINKEDLEYLEHVIHYNDNIGTRLEFLLSKEIRKSIPEPKLSVYLKILIGKL